LYEHRLRSTPNGSAYLSDAEGCRTCRMADRRSAASPAFKMYPSAPDRVACRRVDSVGSDVTTITLIAGHSRFMARVAVRPLPSEILSEVVDKGEGEERGVLFWLLRTTAAERPSKERYAAC